MVNVMNEGQDRKRTAADIRSTILATRVRNKRFVNFMGETIELRQPTVRDVLDTSDDGDDGTTAIVKMIVKYAYVPGTEQRVFDDTHVNDLLALPYTSDFNEIAGAISELTGGNVKAQEKN